MNIKITKKINTLINNYWIAEKNFIIFCIQNFFKDDCIYRASALAFTSLLSIVPLLSVGLTIFSSLPVFREYSDPIQKFIFHHFVPETGYAVYSYLSIFTEKINHLSIFGIVGLFISALLTMLTIEQAFNKIWKINQARKGVAAFLLYWSILSLTPLLIGLSLAANSYINTVSFIQPFFSLLLYITPFSLSFISFMLLYWIVPNTNLKIHDVFWGSLIATILFESAKHTFSFYIRYYAQYESLYGAFAILPIFLIWIYLTWIITLLGAEISYALSVPYQRRIGRPMNGIIHALSWIQALFYAQKKGEGLSLVELIAVSTQPFSIDVELMLNNLSRINLIHCSSDNKFYLSKEIGDINLYWLIQELPFPYPFAKDIEKTKITLPMSWLEVFNNIEKNLSADLNISLHQLFKNKENI